MDCENSTEELIHDLNAMKKTVELAELVIARVTRELERLVQRRMAMTTSLSRPEPQADPLDPDLPLREQLTFAAKPEPASGEHAARLVSAARHASTKE